MSQILEALGASVDVIARKLEAVLVAAHKSGNTPYSGVPTVQVFITPRLNRVMGVANDEANKLQDEYISTEHILLAIASERNTHSANILRDAGVTKERLYGAIEDLRGGQSVNEPEAESKFQVLGKVWPRPDPSRRRRKTGPCRRPRRRGHARDAGSVSAL